MTSTSSTLTKKAPFLETKSFSQLKKLAESPFDLTQPNALTPARIDHFCLKSMDWTLLYGTERVTDEVMDALYSLAEERDVHGQMLAMQQGEIVNVIEGYPSEKRSVLHTAMRDLFSDQLQTTKPAVEARDLALKEDAKLKAFIKANSDKFDTIVTVAIGGSDLGPQALYLALADKNMAHKKAYFISNVDPDHGASILKEINLKNTLVMVVSKSGTTLETATNEALVAQAFKEQGLNLKDHFIAITSQGSPMDNPDRYLACFYMWDFVGGRFSATSMAGGVLLSFMLGYETYLEVMKGAHKMDRHVIESAPRKNLPLTLALLGIWNHNFLGYPTVGLIPYSEALYRFPAHIQQVDMESNGKGILKNGERVKFKTGPIIWGEPGTNAQHSFFQLLHQGTEIVPLELIGFQKSQYGKDVVVEGTTSQQKLIANMLAQSIALATGVQSQNPNQTFLGNRPSSILFQKQLTPETMGMLFALYEHKIAYQGFIWGINSFDQEGVQLGKKVANQILGLMKDLKDGKQGSYPLGVAFLKELGLI